MSALTKELEQIIKSDKLKEFMKESQELKGVPFATIFVAFIYWFEKNYCKPASEGGLKMEEANVTASEESKS